MKKIICLLIILLMLCGISLGESALKSIIIPPDDTLLPKISYIHYGDYGLPIGELQELLKISFLNHHNDTEPYFGNTTYESLVKYQEENGLAVTGYFDSDTLRLLLQPSSIKDSCLVWIPMHGGKKFHSKESCSNMIEPRQMPRDCAKSLGFDPCGRCYK